MERGIQQLVGGTRHDVILYIGHIDLGHDFLTAGIVQFELLLRITGFLDLHGKMEPILIVNFMLKK